MVIVRARATGRARVGFEVGVGDFAGIWLILELRVGICVW
jgi:hypothetical protein